MAKKIKSFDLGKYQSKKEKPAKEPKAPKAEKPPKKSKLVSLNLDKPVKEPKEPKVKKLSKKSKAISLDFDTDIQNEPASRKSLIATLLIVVLALAILASAVVFAFVKKTEYDNEIETVSVSSFPKLQYYVGDKFRTDGLQLQVTLNSGESYLVDAEECEFSGFDSSKAVERQTITVSYQGFTCTYKIQIKDAPTLAPVLKTVYLETLPKTEYKVGQWLSTTGGVLMVEYEDGTYMRHNLTNQDVYGFVTDVKNETIVTEAPGTYTLEIRYREGGVTKTTTYDITVTE